MILRMMLDLPADAAYVPIARALSTALLERLNVVRQDIDDANLIIGETCNNVVRHAYRCPNQRYWVEIRYYRDHLFVTVWDRGIGFTRAAVPPPQPGQVGGWGVWLVENIADRVAFEPAGPRGTRVRARLDLHYRTPEARAEAGRLSRATPDATLELGSTKPDEGPEPSSG